MTDTDAEAEPETPADLLARLEEGDVVRFQYERNERITGGGHAEVEDVVKDTEIWVDDGSDEGVIWRATDDGGVVEDRKHSPANVPYVVNLEVVDEEDADTDTEGGST